MHEAKEKHIQRMTHAQPSGHHDGGQSSQLGTLLKRKREECGMSQEALASQLGVSAAQLSRIENGRNLRPSPVVLGKACTILDIPPDDIYTITGYMPMTGLPGLRIYCRAKHPDWPEHVIDKIEEFCDFLCEKHKLQK